MTREEIDGTGIIVDSSTVAWHVFPHEIEEKMKVILRPYGYESDSDELLDASEFLLDVEYTFRNADQPFPWAIIFFPEEYPLAGHLLSIRPNRDIRFSCYSLMNRQKSASFDPAIDGPPPMSIVYVFSKSALMNAAATNSPLLRDAWSVLADKLESGNWVVIADRLDPAWVQEASKESDELFFELSGG